MYFVDDLLSKTPYNYGIGSPRKPERRGGHVAVEHMEARRICEALAHRGVIPDYRPPRTIRLSPIPLYTSYRKSGRSLSTSKTVIDNKEYQKYDPDKKEIY